MWPFRRREEETLNEQLLREAGLADDQPATPKLSPPAEPWPATERQPRPLPNPSTTVVAEAPGIDVDAVQFVTLPNGDLVLEEGDTDTDLSALAEAVERTVPRPYRADCRRDSGAVWFLTVKRVDIREFAYEGADELQLVRRGGLTELAADGRPVDGSVPEQLEAAGEAQGAEYAVQADRVDGDSWEIRATGL